MTNEQKKKRSELKREAILEGAQLAFKEFGVGDTSMDKIAETANVSKRTVYNHFESKEVLVSHIIRDIWSKTMVAYEITYSRESSLKNQLLELILNELNLIQNQEFFELIRVAVGHTIYSSNEFRLEMRQFFEQETALIRWLKAAQQDGKLQNVSALKINDQIVSLLKGQAVWPQVLGFEAALNESEKAELASETVDLILCRYSMAKTEQNIQ